MLIEISLEPPGGSPTGRPTGPVLFIGRLAAARGAESPARTRRPCRDAGEPKCSPRDS